MEYTKKLRTTHKMKNECRKQLPSLRQKKKNNKNLLVKGKVVCKLNERFCCISVNYFFG